MIDLPETDNNIARFDMEHKMVTQRKRNICSYKEGRITASDIRKYKDADRILSLGAECEKEGSR